MDFSISPASPSLSRLSQMSSSQASSARDESLRDEPSATRTSLDHGRIPPLEAADDDPDEPVQTAPKISLTLTSVATELSRASTFSAPSTPTPRSPQAHAPGREPERKYREHATSTATPRTSRNAHADLRKLRVDLRLDTTARSTAQRATNLQKKLRKMDAYGLSMHGPCRLRFGTGSKDQIDMSGIRQEFALRAEESGWGEALRDFNKDCKRLTADALNALNNIRDQLIGDLFQDSGPVAGTGHALSITPPEPTARLTVSEHPSRKNLMPAFLKSMRLSISGDAKSRLDSPRSPKRPLARASLFSRAPASPRGSARERKLWSLTITDLFDDNKRGDPDVQRLRAALETVVLAEHAGENLEALAEIRAWESTRNPHDALSLYDRLIDGQLNLESGRRKDALIAVGELYKVTLPHQENLDQYDDLIAGTYKIIAKFEAAIVEEQERIDALVNRDRSLFEPIAEHELYELLELARPHQENIDQYNDVIALSEKIVAKFGAAIVEEQRRIVALSEPYRDVFGPVKTEILTLLDQEKLPKARESVLRQQKP